MSVWQTTAPMWLWQHSCEDESRKLTDGISDLFVFHCDFFCRTKMLMMIYRVRSFLRSPPSRMNTAWCKRSTRSSVLLTGEQGVWERCDTRAQPRPRGDVSVTTVTRHTHRQETLPSLTGVWGGCLYCYHTPPESSTPLRNATTLLSHRPQPFSSPRAISLRADCHLCSEKDSPICCFFAGSLIHFFSVFWLAGCCWRGSQTVSCQRPPNKPALVHRPPPSDKISSKAAIWEDLCWFILNFRTDYSVCGGLKTVITRPYTFCNWGHFNWIELYWIFGSLGATQEPLQEPWGSPKPHLESHCSSRIESKRRTERERERVAT